MFPKRLTEGYQSFLNGRLPSERNRYQALAERGQSPEVLIIGCSDSRVSPEVIFDAGPGEMFVIRNVASLVPPCEIDAASSSYHGTSAAIEFAVSGLNVKHIVVLGHAHCGGVKAFAEKAAPLTPGDFIGNWMRLMAPAVEKAGSPDGLSHAEYVMRLEQANIGNSLANLLTFPRLRKLIENGEVATHGAYFGVAAGKLSVHDEKTGAFIQAAAEEYTRLFGRSIG